MSVKRYEPDPDGQMKERSFGDYILASDHDAALAERDRRIAELEQKLSNVIQEVRQGCNEIEWFASRKKDLSTAVDNSRSETWADVLLADVGAMRALVKKQALAAPDKPQATVPEGAMEGEES
jgi:hypothetical protein